MIARGMLCAAIAAAPAALFAQNIRAGSVVSRGDSLPVVAAEVSVIGNGAHARTDESGRFRIVVHAGDTLRVRAMGFREVRQAVEAGEMRVALQPLPTQLAALTTTAGQRVIRTAETTANTTIVGREEIDADGAVAVNDVLRRIPGLTETPSEPSRTSIAIHGLDGPRVLVLVDGEPVTGTLIDDRDIGRLSTLAVDRIEVTKGPSSVEFGSDALGGVINLVTAPPAPGLDASATVRAGELGRMEGSAGVSGTRGAFGFRLDGSWRQENEVTAVNDSGSSLDRVYDLRSDFRYKLSDAVSFRTDIQLSQERQRWPVGGGYNGFIDDKSGQGFVEAQIKTLGGNVRARAFGQLFSYEYRQAQDLLPIAGSADSLVQRERQAQFLLAYSRVAGVQTIDAGTQYSARAMVAPQKVEGDSASDRVTEFFVRDALGLGPTIVTLGARTTSSSLWGSAFSPSIGAAWQIASAWRAQANVARGFRAPSFKEIGYTFVNAAAGYEVAGNHDLVPETSWNSSIGATWAPAPALSIELEAYRNDVANLIDTRFTGTSPAGLQIYQNVNVSQARTEGVETNVRYTIGLTEASIGYTYLNARDLETGAQLAQQPKHTARARISRTWSVRSGLTTDLSARFTGAAPVGTLTQEAFLSVDAQLRLEFTRSMEWSVGVNNLLNQRPALWTPAFQRQVFAGVRLKWSESPR
jgi:outer membrane receptor for ferrienterochelin and colicins